MKYRLAAGGFPQRPSAPALARLMARRFPCFARSSSLSSGRYVTSSPSLVSRQSSPMAAQAEAKARLSVRAIRARRSPSLGRKPSRTQAAMSSRKWIPISSFERSSVALLAVADVNGHCDAHVNVGCVVLLVLGVCYVLHRTPL
jgi:hypothetical protein